LEKVAVTKFAGVVFRTLTTLSLLRKGAKSFPEGIARTISGTNEE
jgi:hypothetical protein